MSAFEAFDLNDERDEIPEDMPLAGFSHFIRGNIAHLDALEAADAWHE
jgi:hypothetical protein